MQVVVKIDVVPKAGLTVHIIQVSYCLIEVVTKAGLTINIMQVIA
jgi:hypothetical protein